jgi:hypothetical protein
MDFSCIGKGVNLPAATPIGKHERQMSFASTHVVL